MIKCPKCNSAFVVIFVNDDYNIAIECEECEHRFILRTSTGFLNRIIEMWDRSYKKGEENVQSI